MLSPSRSTKTGCPPSLTIASDHATQVSPVRMQTFVPRTNIESLQGNRKCSRSVRASDARPSTDEICEAFAEPPLERVRGIGTNRESLTCRSEEPRARYVE